jgi:hypothetical protein
VRPRGPKLKPPKVKLHRPNVQSASRARKAIARRKDHAGRAVSLHRAGVLKAVAKVAEDLAGIVRKAEAARKVDAKAAGASVAIEVTIGAAAIEGASKGHLKSISKN